MSPGATKTDPCTGLSTIRPAFTSLQPPCGRHSEEQASGFSPLWAFPLPGVVSRHPWTHPLSTSPFFQGLSRPTRSLSTAQLVQPSGGLQASVISNIVLMKGQAKVSKDHGQGRLLDGHVFPRSWWGWGQGLGIRAWNRSVRCSHASRLREGQAA